MTNSSRHEPVERLLTVAEAAEIADALGDLAAGELNRPVGRNPGRSAGRQSGTQRARRRNGAS